MSEYSVCKKCTLSEICKYREELENLINKAESIFDELGRYVTIKMECGKYPNKNQGSGM